MHAYVGWVDFLVVSHLGAQPFDAYEAVFMKQQALDDSKVSRAQLNRFAFKFEPLFSRIEAKVFVDSDQVFIVSAVIFSH